MPAYKDTERNTWTSSFRYVDWTGKQQRKLKRGFKTKKEALEFEARYKLTANANMDMTLEAFVDVYFKDKAGELKYRTIKNKKYMIESHVIPYLGKKKMNEITPADIIAWQSEIRGKNYSETYMRMLQNQVTALFTHAFKIYGLTNNPCQKVKKIGKSDVRRLNFWTQEEYQKFIETFEVTSRGYVMFQILFWTGCRLGEMLALAKEDIEFDNNRIHIRKTYYRDNGKDIITLPKTEESIRTVEIPSFLSREIKAYCNTLYEYPENRRLFPLTARGVEKLMDRHIEKAGVKRIEVHSLRHSSAAWQIHQGISAMVIKERLGHKDIRITLNTYGHLYPSEQRKVADMMDKMFDANRTAPTGNRDSLKID